jgi:hypothetical protein
MGGFNLEENLHKIAKSTGRRFLLTMAGYVSFFVDDWMYDAFIREVDHMPMVGSPFPNQRSRVSPMSITTSKVVEILQKVRDDKGRQLGDAMYEVTVTLVTWGGEHQFTTTYEETVPGQPANMVVVYPIGFEYLGLLFQHSEYVRMHVSLNVGDSAMVAFQAAACGTTVSGWSHSAVLEIMQILIHYLATNNLNVEGFDKQYFTTCFGSMRLWLDHFEQASEEVFRSHSCLFSQDTRDRRLSRNTFQQEWDSVGNQSELHAHLKHQGGIGSVTVYPCHYKHLMHNLLGNRSMFDNPVTPENQNDPNALFANFKDRTCADVLENQQQNSLAHGKTRVEVAAIAYAHDLENDCIGNLILQAIDVADWTLGCHSKLEVGAVVSYDKMIESMKSCLAIADLISGKEKVNLLLETINLWGLVQHSQKGMIENLRNGSVYVALIQEAFAKSNNMNSLEIVSASDMSLQRDLRLIGNARLDLVQTAQLRIQRPALSSEVPNTDREVIGALSVSLFGQSFMEKHRTSADDLKPVVNEFLLSALPNENVLDVDCMRVYSRCGDAVKTTASSERLFICKVKFQNISVSLFWFDDVTGLCALP